MIFGNINRNNAVMNKKRDEQREKSKNKDAAKNVKDFYNNNHQLCELAFEYYEGYQTNKNKYVNEAILVDKEEFLSHFCGRTVLVLTATEIEESIFLRWISEKIGRKLDTYSIEGQISCNCIQAREDVAILHLHMTETGEECTRRELNRVRKLFSPDYLVMLGICYGINMDDTIGTVFLADKINTYRIDFKEDENGEGTQFIARKEYEKVPDDAFVTNIRSVLNYTQVHNVISTIGQPNIVNIRHGSFLSSNSLMSSYRVKNAIINKYRDITPEAVGGEMEGGGILKSYFVEEEGFGKWLLIKSICDWGEKKNKLHKDKACNDKIKDSIQAYAMSNTCSAFDKILSVL